MARIRVRLARYRPDDHAVDRDRLAPDVEAQRILLADVQFSLQPDGRAAGAHIEQLDMGAQANPTLDSLDDETGMATLVPQGPAPLR